MLSDPVAVNVAKIRSRERRSAVRFTTSVLCSFGLGVLTFVACGIVDGSDLVVSPDIAATIRGGLCYDWGDCPASSPDCDLRCSNISGCTSLSDVWRFPLVYCNDGCYKLVQNVVCTYEPNCKYSNIGTPDCSTTEAVAESIPEGQG
jgi:hypothetical protein